MTQVASLCHGLVWLRHIMHGLSLSLASAHFFLSLCVADTWCKILATGKLKNNKASQTYTSGISWMLWKETSCFEQNCCLCLHFSFPFWVEEVYQNSREALKRQVYNFQQSSLTCWRYCFLVFLFPPSSWWVFLILPLHDFPQNFQNQEIPSKNLKAKMPHFPMDSDENWW